MLRSISVSVTIAVTAALFAFVGHAGGAPRDRDGAACSSNDDDKKIAGCSALMRRDICDDTITCARIYYNRGVAYSNKGDHERAIADFSEAIKNDPGLAAAYTNRGRSYLEIGDHTRAIRDLGVSISLDGKSPLPSYNRAIAWFRHNDFDRAIEDFEETIRRDPAFVEAYVYRGMIYDLDGDSDKARAAFNAALSIPARSDSERKSHENARKLLAELEKQRPPRVAEVPPLPAPPPSTRPSRSGPRVALVIGNSNYRNVPVLPNAQSDANLLASALRETGFQTVSIQTDLTREQLLDVLRAFARDAEGAEWATIYYAGHGVEMNGVNYLVPIDAKLSVDRDLDFEAVPLDRLLSAVDGAKKLRLVVLDACRDNPFLNQMRRTVATRSVGRGLARVEPDAGTLVVFAAKHGQVALDGEGENGPFVSALVKRIKTPGLEVRRLFDVVRDDVMAATDGRQQPFSYGSVSGRQDFFFVAP